MTGSSNPKSRLSLLALALGTAAIILTAVIAGTALEVHAHPINVAWRCEPNGDVTFFVAHRHDNNPPTGGFNPESKGGIKLDGGTTRLFTGVIDDLPGDIDGQRGYVPTTRGNPAYTDISDVNTYPFTGWLTGVIPGPFTDGTYTVSVVPGAGMFDNNAPVGDNHQDHATVPPPPCTTSIPLGPPGCAFAIEDPALETITFSANIACSAPLPTVSIDDVSMKEGDAGTTNFDFTVTRSDNTTAFMLSYFTGVGTAGDGNFGSDTDYVSASGTLTFTVGGALMQTITVQVNGDTTVETDETFYVDLAKISGDAALIDGQGKGTIQNDDPATLTPTPSNTPTDTSTPTPSNTPTDTSTPTPTNTPEPVSAPVVSITDPFGCTNNGDTLNVQVVVDNPGAAITGASVQATLPVGLTGLAGTCTFAGGSGTPTCVVTPTDMTWTGDIPAASSVTIDYQVRVAAGVPAGAPLCITTVFDTGAGTASTTECSAVDCPPTSVALLGFSAIGLADRSLVVWETAAETDLLGFNLYRAASLAGPWNQVNPDLVAGRGGAASGRVYMLRDAPVPGDVYYRLEEVDSTAKRSQLATTRTRVGPDAEGRTLFLPRLTAPSGRAGPLLHLR